MLKVSFNNGIKSRLVREFHTTLKVSGAPIPKFGYSSIKSNGGSRPKRKGVAGSSKKFQDYVNNSGFNKLAPTIDLPVLEEFLANKESELNNEDNKLFKYSDKSLKSLYHFGSFGKHQFNELFNTKYSLLRKETLEIINNLKHNNNSKFFIMGESGIGKTTLITQIQSYLKNQSKIILPIFQLEKITNGSFDFSLNSKTGLYEQPNLLKIIMVKFAKGNKDLLKKLLLSKSYSYGTMRYLENKNSVYDLCLFNGKISLSFYETIFRDILKELKSQKKYGVYLTIDNFNALTNKPYSEYRDANNKPIPVEKLSLINLFLKIINDEYSLNEETGVVISTTGRYILNSTLLNGLYKKESLPFDKEFDENLSKYFRKFDNKNIFELEKLNKDEIFQLVRFQLNNGLLISRDDKYFNPNKNIVEKNLDLEKITNEKYILSGNGNPKEFLKACNLLYY